MRKVLALALLAAFFSSVAAEAMEGICPESETECCVCLCQATPALQTVKDHVQAKAPLTYSRLVIPGAHIAKQLFDKSIFHPPEVPPHNRREAPVFWRFLA